MAESRGLPAAKVVVGLGNPGPDYESTRHNAGWRVVDRFASDQGIGPFKRERRAWEAAGETTGGARIRLLKPRTYMNRSGLALSRLWQDRDFDAARDLLVVADDASLPPGRVRFRRSGGAGGHNGLKSVARALGTREYARLRIGVGAPAPGTSMTDWVLSPMEPEDEDVVAGLLPELSKAIGVWAEEGVDAAMNRFNR